MAEDAPARTHHASCVDIGGRGVLIRGPSGSGKSRLALRLIFDPPRILPAATLVGDDRLFLDRQGPDLLARPAPALAGLIEVRFLGLRRLPHLRESPVHLVVDLAAEDAARLPDEGAGSVEIAGLLLPRMAIPQGEDAALLVAAALASEKS